MAFTAEAGTGVHHCECHRPGSFKLVCVQAGLNVTFEDSDPGRRTHLFQGLPKQRGLSAAGRRHQVHCSDPCVSKSTAVVVRDAIILREQVLEDGDPGVAGLDVPRVVTDIYGLRAMISLSAAFVARQRLVFVALEGGLVCMDMWQPVCMDVK